MFPKTFSVPFLRRLYQVALTGLLTIVAGALLVACGDVASSPVPGGAVNTSPTAAATTAVTTTTNPATTATSTTQVVTTAAPTTSAATTKAATSAPAPAKTTAPTTTKVAYNPVVKASQTNVKRGQEITLSGSGFPDSTELSINGGVQNPGNDYGTVKTDGAGNFSQKLTIVSKNMYDGLYFIYVSTADFKWQNHVQFNVLPEAAQGSTDTEATRQSVTSWFLTSRNLKADQIDLQIGGVAGDYVRFTVQPGKANPNLFQGSTIFVKHDGQSWKQLLAGSAFSQDDLRQAGIPQSLWSN